jgi:hypothetical protein
LDAKLTIRCDVFIALVHLSDLIDYCVSVGPAILTGDANLKLQAWEYKMWLLLEESSFWSVRLKRSYASDWRIPAPLAERTMRVSCPDNPDYPDYLRCQDHKADCLLYDTEFDDTFNWSEIGEAGGTTHAISFERAGM